MPPEVRADTRMFSVWNRGFNLEKVPGAKRPGDVHDIRRALYLLTWGEGGAPFYVTAATWFALRAFGAAKLCMSPGALGGLLEGRARWEAWGGGGEFSLSPKRLASGAKRPWRYAPSRRPKLSFTLDSEAYPTPSET